MLSSFAKCPVSINDDSSVEYYIFQCEFCKIKKKLYWLNVMKSQERVYWINTLQTDNLAAVSYFMNADKRFQIDVSYSALSP